MSSVGPKQAIFASLAEIAQALGHANRLELLEHLGQGERSVEELALHALMAALLTQAGIWGPRDILEGEAGFFKAFSGEPKPEKITGDLGQGYRLM